MSETKEFYIDSDGIRLHAKQDVPEGVKKGPLCILIHGFTGNMEAARLYKNARLIGIKGAQHCFEGHEVEMADAIREYLAEIGK